MLYVYFGEYTFGRGDTWTVNDHVDVVGTIGREPREDGLNLGDAVLVGELGTAK